MTADDPRDPLAPLRHDDGGMPSFGDDTLAAVMGRGRKLRQRRRGLYSAGTALAIAGIAIAGIAARGGTDAGSFDRIATSPSPNSGSASPHHSPGHKHNGSGPGSVIVGGNPGGSSGGHHGGGGTHHPAPSPPVSVCDTPTAPPPTVDPTATTVPIPCTPPPSTTPTDSPPPPTDSPTPPPPTDSPPAATASPDAGQGPVTSNRPSASR
jgi:hypothetical protein